MDPSFTDRDADPDPYQARSFCPIPRAAQLLSRLYGRTGVERVRLKIECCRLEFLDKVLVPSHQRAVDTTAGNGGESVRHNSVARTEPSLSYAYETTERSPHFCSVVVHETQSLKDIFDEILGIFQSGGAANYILSKDIAKIGVMQGKMPGTR